MSSVLVTDDGTEIVDENGNPIVAVERGEGYYFCGENCSLYDSSIFPIDSLPASVVELTEEDYNNLLSKQAEGYLILADEEGLPYAVKQGCGDCDGLQLMTFRGIFYEGNFNDFKKYGVYEINGETADKFKNAPNKDDCIGVLEVYEVNNGELVEHRFSGIYSYRRFFLKTVDKWSTWVQFLSPEGGKISSDEIADNAITEDKIKDYAITQKKIAAYAVGKDEIEIEGIETQNLKPYCVTSEKIADSAVTSGKLAASSVTKEKIGDYAIDSKHIAFGAITNDRLSVDSVSTEKIQDASVTSEKLAEGLTLNAVKINGGNAGSNNDTYVILDNTTVNGDLDVKYDAKFQNDVMVNSLLTTHEMALPVQDIIMGTSYSSPILRAAEKRNSNMAGVKIEISFDEGKTWHQLCCFINNTFTVGS